jgi:hypothetical protein
VNKTLPVCQGSQRAGTKMETATETAALLAPGQPRRSWRSVLMIALALFGLALLAYYFFGRERETGAPVEGAPRARRSLLGTLLGGLRGFGADGEAEVDDEMAAALASRQAGPNTMLAAESPDSLLRLAQRLRDSGMQLKGVSQCLHTRLQREAFGGRDSEARKILESLYTECRSEKQCPNIRGYPTWTLGDNRWPGNRSANNLRELVTQAEQLNPRRMLQAPAEPQAENFPDAQHVERGPADDEQLADDMVAQLIEADAYGDAVAEIESNKEGAASAGAAAATTTPAPTGGANPAVAGGAAAGAAGGGFAPDGSATLENEAAAPAKRPRRAAAKKENVRGVSNYPPLNVPVMPGTAPFLLDMEYHDDQTRQGNVPRASAENPAPTAGLVQQQVQALEPLAAHLARAPGAATVAQNRYPQAADISTGDPFADKTVYVEKN